MKKRIDLSGWTREQLLEQIGDRMNYQLARQGMTIEEVETVHLRSWLVRNLPCPTVKRNGEVCGSDRVSVSGHCFAHDPEAASWRAMGGRAKAKKARARKKLKELGLDHMTEALEEVFDQLHETELSATNARAMAGIAATVMKLTEWAAELDRDPQPPKNGGWMPYEP